jgi:hypothetical protein
MDLDLDNNIKSIKEEKVCVKVNLLHSLQLRELLFNVHCLKDLKISVYNPENDNITKFDKNIFCKLIYLDDNTSFNYKIILSRKIDDNNIIDFYLPLSRINNPIYISLYSECCNKDNDSFKDKLPCSNTNCPLKNLHVLLTFNNITFNENIESYIAYNKFAQHILYNEEEKTKIIKKEFNNITFIDEEKIIEKIYKQIIFFKNKIILNS